MAGKGGEDTYQIPQSVSKLHMAKAKLPEPKPSGHNRDPQRHGTTGCVREYISAFRIEI